MSVSAIHSSLAQAAMDSLLNQDAVRLQNDAQALMEGASHNQGGMDFEQLLRRVDDKDQAASERMEAVERGESDDLVGAMLASQEASLSFSMLMQVRNKVVGAVDELIKLQL